MRKRLMSLLLAFSMLLSMLPVPSMAAETDWDVEPEESPAVDADVILPVGAPEEDGELSLFGVEELGGDAYYVYPDQTIIQMMNVKLQAEALPDGWQNQTFYLELINGDGEAVAQSDTPASFGYWDGGWNLEFAGMQRPADLAAGTYTARLQADDNDAFIPVNQAVVVLSTNQLMLTDLQLRGFYTGVPSFTAMVWLEGFAEEDLDALRLSLLNAENEEVASSGTKPGILRYYDDGAATLAVKLLVKEGVLLDADETYRIAIAYDSEKTLYTNAASASFDVESTPLVEKVSIHNARDAALLVETANCDPEQTYTVTVSDYNGYTIYGTYTGTITGNRVIVELGEAGATLPITSYANAFYLKLSWTGGETDPYYYASPYFGALASPYDFQPEYELCEAGSFPFVLTVPASAADFDGSDVVQLRSADGTLISAAANVAAVTKEGKVTITGRLSHGQMESGEICTVVLNGNTVSDVRFLDDSPYSRHRWNTGYYNSSSFWTEFGEFWAKTVIFNGPDSGTFCFRNSSGETVLSGEVLTAQAGVTPTYRVFEYAFDAEDLQALTSGSRYTLVLVSDTGEEYEIFSNASFRTAVSMSYGLYVDLDTAVVDAQTLGLTANLQSLQNVTEEALLENLVLERSYYDPATEQYSEVLVPITDLEVGAVDQVHSVPMTLTLGKALEMGDYALYLGDSYLAGFYVPNSAEAVPYILRSDLAAGYLTAKNLASAAYTFKLYDDDSLLTSGELRLEDGATQYLYFDPSLVENLPAGTYYLRIYANGELFSTCEGTVEEATEAIVRVRDRLLTNGVVALELDCLGEYSFMRFGLSEQELETSSFFSVLGISSMSRTFQKEDGPATLYVELSKDLTGQDSEVFTFDLYVCSDNDYDLQTEAEEPILIFAAAGTTYTLQATTEHPYARVWATFVNENDVEIRVELEKKGLRTADGRCVYELEIPASLEALIPNSTIPYCDAVSVTLSATDQYEYTKGKTVTRSFSLKNLDSIYIYGLNNGVVTLGKDDVLYGIASANSTVTIKIQGLETVTEDYFETDKTGKFVVDQMELGSEQSTVTVIDGNLGQITFDVIVDTEAPVVTGELTRDSTGGSTIRWSTEDTDVAEYRIYKNSTLLSTLSAENTVCSTGNPFGAGVCYYLQAEDAAGNVTTVKLIDGVSLTDDLSWTFDDATGTLELHGEGEVPDNPYWSCGAWNVKNLILPDGLTEIGENAFSGMPIQTVTIPGSVEYVRDYAFSGCSQLTDVTLQEGVGYLMDSAFSGCKKLTTIHFPASLQIIEPYTFSGCDSLAAFTVAEGNDYFKAMDGVLFSVDGKILYRYPAGKKDLTAYTVPADVTGLMAMAFASTALTTVTLQEGVTEMEHSIFTDCANLTTVHLPASLYYMSNSVFRNCPSLQTITLAEGNEDFVIENGCLYDIGKTTLHSCFGKKTQTAFTAPETLIDLCEGSLSDCTALTTVVLNKGLSSIPAEVFSGCTGLTEITIPSSVQEIGFFAFEDCSALTTVHYGGSTEMWLSLMDNTEIGNDLLKAITPDCQMDYATEGPCGESLNYVFDEETGVLTITGTGDMTRYSQADRPWNNFAEQIKSVVLEEGITSLCSWAFADCTALTTLELPDSLARIGSYAFTDSGLTSIHLSAGVTELEHSVFGGAMSLRTITVEDGNAAYKIVNDALCSIDGSRLIRYFGSAAAYEMANTVETVDDSAFANCTQLETMVLSTGLREISSRTFYGCSGLTEITIPGSVSGIYAQAFRGCTSLAYVKFIGTEAMWQALMADQDGRDNDALVNITPTYQTSIGGKLGQSMYWTLDLTTGKLNIMGSGYSDDYAGSSAYPWGPYLQQIQSVIIEEGVEGLGYGPFMDAVNLKTAELPSTLRYISSEMFARSGLVELEIPVNANGAEASCFNGCKQLKSITAAEGHPYYFGQDGVLFTKLEEGVSSLAVYPAGRTDLSYTVPASVQYVEWNAFCGNGYLQTLTISEGVQGLQNGALQNCTALQTVQLPATLQYIASSNFTGCTSLTSVQYAGLESMWSNVSVDEGNDQLPKLPQCADRYTTSGTTNTGAVWSFDSATGILELSGNGTVDACYGPNPEWALFSSLVTEAVVGSGIRALDCYTFDGMENLKAITVASGNLTHFSDNGVLYRIYEYPEGNQISLEEYPAAKTASSYTIFEGTTDIGFEAFNGNSNLTEIILPEGVTYISAYAFAGCTALTSVVLPFTLNMIFYCAFEDTAVSSVTYRGTKENWANVSVDYADDGNAALQSAAFTYEPLGQSGSSGDVRWKLDEETGVLTISGIGYMKDYEDDGLPPWAEFADQIVSVDVLPGVFGVGNYAFMNLTKLKSVSLPSTLTRLGAGAFRFCEALEQIAIPDMVHEIYTYTFQGCSSLQTLELHEDIIYADPNAFRGCAALTAITVAEGNQNYWSLDGVLYRDMTLLLYPMGKQNATFTFPTEPAVQAIESVAFNGNKWLQEVSLPHGISEIPMSAFAVCPNLTTLRLTNSVTVVADGAFSGCSNLKAVYFAGTQAQWEALTVGTGNEALTSVVPTLTNLSGVSADGLSWTLDYGTGTLTISGTGAMMSYAGVADMPWAKDAENILRVVTEEGVTSLHASILRLPNLTEVTLAASCTGLSSWMTDAALSCSYPKLAAIHVAAGNRNYQSVDGVLFSSDGTFLYRYPEAKVGDSYTIPETVTFASPYAFYNAKLRSLTIPASVTWIDETTLAGCEALTEIHYGGTWAEWEALRFQPDVDEVIFANPSGTWNGLSWTLNGTTGHLTISGSGPMGNVFLDSAWREYDTAIRTVTLETGVTTIGWLAFESCGNLTALTVPETVTLVEKNALNSCSALKTVTFTGDAPRVEFQTHNTSGVLVLYPEGRYGWEQTWGGFTTQSYVPEGAVRYFSGQGGSVSYDTATGTLLDSTVGLTALIIPAELGITTIAENAFRNSPKLQYVVLPKSVQNLGENAIPAGVTLYGAADSAAAAYAKANGLEFAVPTVTLSPASYGTIGGDFAAMTAVFDLYAALPLELETNAQGLTWEITPGEWFAYRLDIALDLTGVAADGEYEFRVSNADYGISQTVLYSVDVTPPQTIADLTATGAIHRNVVSWRKAADANVTKYEIYRADSEDGPRTLVQTITGRETTGWTDTQVEVETPYFYWIIAEDIFGQTSAPAGPVTATALKDTEPPQITAISPENGTAVRGDLALLVGASDNIRLRSITAEISIDNKTWEALEPIETSASACFVIDTTRWTKETLYVRLSALDDAGNKAEGSTIYQYAVDNQAPGDITTLEAVQALSTIITLAWNDVSDEDFDHFLVQQLIDGSWHTISRVTAELGINLTGLTPGTAYTYSVSAVDRLGNQGQSREITVTTAADTTAPVITSIRPGPGRYISTVPLTIRAEDDHGLQRLQIQVSQDSGQSWNTVYTAENPGGTLYYNLDLSQLAEGLLRVRPVAVDRSGNESDQSETAPFVEYYVDRTAPAAPQTVTASSGNGFIWLAWAQAEEEDAGPYRVYRAESEDGPFTCVMADQAVLSLKDNAVSFGKTYYYYVTIRDQAGNVSAPSQIVSCQCAEDQQKPTVVSISPSDGSVLSAATAIKVKAGDNNQLASVTYRWSEDAESWTEETMAVSGAETIVTLPITLHSGTLKLEVRCTDISGWTSDTVTRTYTIDTQAPAVPALSAALTDTGIALTWSGGAEKDLAGYIVYRKSGDETTWQKLLQRAAGKAEYAETDTAVECGQSYQYYIQAVDTCGNQADGTPLDAIAIGDDWIGGLDTTNPVAIITGSLTGTREIEMTFSGESSWDDRAVETYLWDFGDGGVSRMPAPVHAFANAGTYTVKLTVTDAAGNSHMTSVQVDIKEPQVLGTLVVRVTDENGKTVPNAGVYFDLGADDQSVSYTDSLGQVRLQVPVGVHTVGAYLEGYLPAKTDAEIIAGIVTEVTLVTVQKELVVGELTVRRMTLEEIKAAGINTADPANQEVFEFVIELTYGTFHQTVTTTCNSQGKTLKDPDPIIFDDEDGIRRKLYVGVIPVPVGGNGSSGGTGGGGGETEVPTVVVLEIPGTATWLKDFFEVQLTVLNQADRDFWLDDCLAVLNVPDGLTLMDSNYTTSDPAVSMGSVQGQSSAAAYWIIRGDTAGAYQLSADFSATLRDFDADVRATFETDEPFEVRQNAGLSMVVEVENTIVANTDGALRVGLRNDHALPYYLPKINLDAVVYPQKTYKTVGVDVVENGDLDQLNAGETIWFEYIVPRDSWDTLMKREGEDFYLHEAVVKSIGGTTTLPVTVEELPPFSICADKVVVTQRDENGVESPIDLISIRKNLLQTAKIPTLVIRTYALQEDGTYLLSDMDVKLTDPGKKDGTVKKEKTGTYIYAGYPITTLDNLKTYSIVITAARTQTIDGVEQSITRCRPVEIPVVLRGATADTGNIDVKVYGQVGASSVAMEGASVSIVGYEKLTGQSGPSGGVLLTGVPLGYHEILIEADGYMPIRDVINVVDKAEFAYSLTEDPDPGKSKILRVSNTLNDYSTGNVTVIPEGHVNGSIYFTPDYELVEGDTFVGFRYRRISNGVVAETKNFKTEAGYPVDMTTLKAGDRIHFALVYADANGKEHVSKYTDSLVVVADAPGFFENLVYDAQDMQYGLPLNPGKNFTLDPTKFIKSFKISSIMAGGLTYDGESFEAMAGMLNTYSFTESEYSPIFPLAVKYDPSGKLTISLIFGGEYENKTEGGFVGGGAAVSNQGFSGFTVAGHTNGPVGTKNSSSLFLDFIIQYDAAMDNWNLTIRGGISAAQSLTLAKAEFYKVAYVSLDGELEETLAWKFFERKVGALDTDGITKLGMDLDEVMASFGIKAAAGLQLFEDDWASAGLYLRGKLVFNLVPAFSAKMEAAVGGEYQVLFWGDSKDFKSMTWNLYSQQGGSGYSLRDLMLQGSDTLTMTAMPKNLLSLHAENPDLFRSDVYGGVHARMTQLPDGSQLLVWLDYTGDRNDPVKVKAVVLGEAGETLLDRDDTPDLMPYVAATDTGAVAVWTDFRTNLSGLQELTYDQLLTEMPGKLGVSAAFYDAQSGQWTDPVPLETNPTAASEPVAISDGSQTLVAWIANDSNLDHSAQSPEYISWVLLKDGQIAERGKVENTGLDLTELNLGCYYGQFQMAVLGHDGTAGKIYTAAFEGSGWSELTKLNTIAADDSVMTFGADGSLYYLNSGRILHCSGGSAVQILESELLQDAVTNLLVTETDAGSVLTWTTVANSESVVCMSLVDETGAASAPVVVLRGGDGHVDVSATAAVDGGIRTAARVGSQVGEEWVDDLILPVISLETDLALLDSDVIHQGVLYPGAKIVTSVAPTVRGLRAAGGFTAVIARDAAGNDVVARADCPDQRSGSLHWTVPETYNGEPLYLIVTPRNGTDRDMTDNVQILRNAVREISLQDLTYVGNLEGKDTFSLTVSNDGLAALEQTELKLTLLQEEGEDTLVLSHTLEQLEAGSAVTLMLTSEQALDLSQELRFMASVGLQPGETDFSDNRTYLTVAAQKLQDEFLVTETGWQNAAGEAVTELTGETVTFRVNLENLGSDSAKVNLMVACYDGDGKLMRLVPAQAEVTGGDAAIVSAELQTAQLTGAASVKAFVLDGGHTPLCEAGILTQKTE